MFTFTNFLNNRQQPASHYNSVISFFLQHMNFITVKFAMGCIQRNEKLVVRPLFARKLDLRLNRFETKAVRFCEHAAHVVVVKFVKFFAARESNDR